MSTLQILQIKGNFHIMEFVRYVLGTDTLRCIRAYAYLPEYWAKRASLPNT